MGACTFSTVGKGKTADKAFAAAVAQARHEHGHGGYTGTIAEKYGYVLIEPPAGQSRDERKRFAWDLIDAGDRRVDDKWGPAGCIPLGNDEWFFFGWASE